MATTSSIFFSCLTNDKKTFKVYSSILRNHADKITNLVLTSVMNLVQISLSSNFLTQFFSGNGEAEARRGTARGESDLVQVGGIVQVERGQQQRIQLFRERHRLSAKHI